MKDTALEAFKKRRGIGVEPPSPTLTERIYYEAYRTYITPRIRAMTFHDAKTLVHRIFDEIGLERPFFKQSRPGRILGYTTTEHEIFVAPPHYQDTIIHEAAHIITGFYDMGPSGPLEGHSQAWFGNWMFLMLEYSDINVSALSDFARGVSDRTGFNIAAELRVGRNQSAWRYLKPGSPIYDRTVEAGCELHSKTAGEPLPHRDPRPAA